jgi:tetratricopeptide (TPR) repeat protein
VLPALPANFFAVGHGRWLNRLMLEQRDMDMGESRGVAIVSLKLALSQEARASLAAVRVAQEGAQRRARRQTMQARIWLALLVGAVALGAVASRPRVAEWRQSRAKAAKPAPTSPRTPPRTWPIALGPAAPAAMAHAAQPASAAEPSIAKPAAPVVREPEPSVPSAAEPVAVRAKANDTGVPAEGCDTSTRSGLWRRSPAACARAFAADPKNASLALAVAQAEHARAHLEEAAQWAKRALALDPKAAEAYVIIARADAQNGRDEDARTAYQRYLEIAPRGWHKAEAQGALGRASTP